MSPVSSTIQSKSSSMQLVGGGIFVFVTGVSVGILVVLVIEVLAVLTADLVVDIETDSSVDVVGLIVDVEGGLGVDAEVALDFLVFAVVGSIVVEIFGSLIILVTSPAIVVDLAVVDFIEIFLRVVETSGILVVGAVVLPTEEMIEIKAVL